MSESDRVRWDARYQGAAAVTPPCSLLDEYRFLLPAGGDALDLACGLGGNARLLAAHGLDTWAWDIAPNAIEALRRAAPANLRAEVRDVLREPPPAGRFDVIVVSRFLERTVCPALAAALRPGGLLFYQTFARDAVDPGGPRNPAYRLASGELLSLFGGLEILYYADLGRVGDPHRGPRNEARLIAKKGMEP